MLVNSDDRLERTEKFMGTLLRLGNYDDCPVAIAIGIMIGSCAVCVCRFGSACYSQCNAGFTSTQTLGDTTIAAGIRCATGGSRRTVCPLDIHLYAGKWQFTGIMNVNGDGCPPSCS